MYEKLTQKKKSLSASKTEHQNEKLLQSSASENEEENSLIRFSEICWRQ